MAGKSGTEIKIDENSCLRPTNFDERKKTKGRYLNVRPCNENTYVWEILDFNPSKEKD